MSANNDLQFLVRQLYEIAFNTADIAPYFQTRKQEEALKRHVVRGALYDKRNELECTYDEIGTAEEIIMGSKTNHATIINSVNNYRNIMQSEKPRSMYMLALKLLMQVERYIHPGLFEYTSVKHVGLVGYARVGKDEVGRILVKKGFNRVAMADHGKSELDEVIQRHFGFSAFTDDGDNKDMIRGILIAWIDARYNELMEKVINTRGKRSVNTRIYRVQEAQKWIESEGHIWHVTRPNCNPAEPGEMEEIKNMYKEGLISDVVHNDGDLVDLRKKVEERLQADKQTVEGV